MQERHGSHLKYHTKKDSTETKLAGKLHMQEELGKQMFQ